MSQALSLLLSYFIRIDASQHLEDACVVRPARARRTVPYVLRYETFADPFGYLHSVRLSASGLRGGSGVVCTGSSRMRPRNNGCRLRWTIENHVAFCSVEGSPSACP